MDSYSIANKKAFMSAFLKSDLFDRFELREATLHTSFKASIDGARNHDFFTAEELENSSTFLTWEEMRNYVYQLITGSKSPTYFKIVLATSLDKARAISPDIDACFLNVIFKDNQITCTTGVAYRIFTLDKTPDSIWDDRMKKFLFKHDFL